MNKLFLKNIFNHTKIVNISQFERLRIFCIRVLIHSFTALILNLVKAVKHEIAILVLLYKFSGETKIGDLRC